MLEVLEFVRVENEMCGESIGAGNIEENDLFGFDGNPIVLEDDAGGSPKTVPDED